MSDFVETKGQFEEKPFKIELTKNTKGYNWTIRVYGDDINLIKDQIIELDFWAKKNYGAE